MHNSIDYLAELRAGELVEIQGGISAIGNSSFTASYFMRNKVTGDIAAKMMAKLIYFDLVARKSMLLTDEIKQQLQQRKVMSND